MPDFNVSGAAVTDEAVACTESVTINSTTYYRGKLDQMPGLAVLGNTDPDYGAWSATSKGGTRFLVVERPGLPEDSDTGTGSPPDLALDIASGLVYSTTSQTVYFRYLGFGDFLVNETAADQKEVITIHIPGVLPSGSSPDHYYGRWHKDLRITKAEIVIPGTGGMGANANTTLYLRDYDLADGVGNQRNITLNSSVTTSTGWQTLSSPLEITTAGKFVINGDGKNAANLIINLLHEPA